MKRVYDNEMRLIKTIVRMQATGIKVNTDYIRAAIKYEGAKVLAAKADFKRETGRDFRSSSKMFAEICAERNEEFPLTALGNPSFDSKFLDIWKSPIADMINKVRHNEKRISTYYKPFLHYVCEDSRIRASANNAGTVTGRFSYSDPNLQNIPKEDESLDQESLFIVRGCFVPDEDHYIVSIDYSQQEYRLMLDYAGEMTLIKAVLEGADVHQATADLVGVSRKSAKTLNFALLYGSGAGKLSEMLKVSLSEAQYMKGLYFSKLPKVKQFIQAVQNAGLSRGYIFNWLGRRYTLSDNNFAYKLPNYLIQGSGADVIKVAMNRVDDYLIGKRSKLMVQVHDELLFEIHKDELDILPGISRIMETVYEPKNQMTLSTDMSHSLKSWAHRDLKKGSP